MTRSLAKKINKRWPLIVVMIISIGITSSCTRTYDKSSKETSELERAIEEYNSLVAELDSDLEAYRASMPVFAQFLDVAINKIYPLLRESDKAGQWLSKAREQGTLDWEKAAYDKKKAEKILMRIMASVYKDVYSEFQIALESGKLTLPDEQEKIYYQLQVP